LVGGIDYIRNYQSSSTQTHNILVDPMDIGAIPDDRTGAMRVLRYFVLDAFSGVNNSIFRASSYSSMTDSEYKKQLEEIIKESEASVLEYGKDEQEYTKERKALINI
jgi:hypothetical protein